MDEEEESGFVIAHLVIRRMRRVRMMRSSFRMIMRMRMIMMMRI